eukprot:6590733-Ditylum_brightwellii.AAC.1
MSHTAHPLWELKGKVPEKVYFRGTIIAFPGEKEVLRRYLGLSFDEGPTIYVKFLKENDRVLCRTTYRSLTKNELDSPKVKEYMNRIDQLILDSHRKGITYEDTKGPMMKDYM